MLVLNRVLNEVETVIRQVDEEKLAEVAAIFNKNIKVFVDGEGRSGLVGKAFAMRLMHIGYTVYFVGETVTPALQPRDLYVVVSGSGETRLAIVKSQQAKQMGCRILTVTSKQQSTLGRMADEIIIVPGTTKGDNGEERKSIQLLSSLFDQCLHIVLDSLCLLISSKDNVSHEIARSRHSVLE